VTAGVAWYVSAAGVMNGVSGRVVLPVGRPLVTDARVAATA
jgi:succinate-acetate transporter protein